MSDGGHMEKGGTVAAFLFRAVWYASNVALALFCLFTVYFLFGPEALAYFLAGIAIVACLAAVYLAARKLYAAAIKRLEK